MYRQPFKPPLLQRLPPQSSSATSNNQTKTIGRTASNGSTGSISGGNDEETQRPLKKRRISDDIDTNLVQDIGERKLNLKPFKAPKLIHRSNHLDSTSNYVTSSSTLSSARDSVTDTCREPLRTISNESKPSASIPRTNSFPSRSYRKEESRSKFVPTTKQNEVKDTLCEEIESSSAMDSFYLVLWRKPTMKKNKTWDGDGVLNVSKGYANLQDISGRELGRVSYKSTSPLLPGAELSVGGKDVEIDSVISRADFIAGKPFLGNYIPGLQQKKEAQSDKLKYIKTTINPITQERVKQASSSRNEVEALKNLRNDSRGSPGIAPMRAFKSPFSAGISTAQAQAPKLTSSTLGNTKNPTPRHDPYAPNALVMPRPPASMVPKGKQVVDVVVDPLLAKHLRPHQRQGVQFLYECVMGMKNDEGRGAILADEMGLGKTLQTIALIWTLLKQNPIYDEHHQPVAKKVLIVCPVTLVANWKKEFRKWLGLDRIGVFVADDKHARLTDFTMGKVYSIMILGYEKLRNIQDELKKGAPIDLIVADEGHRLKTAQNKASLAIKGFDTDRRVVLTGTLMQNALKEMYETVDLVNPGVLGKYNVFKREFETPIMRSREPEACEEDMEKGEARNQELVELTGKFILRRTADVIAKFLPPKTEIVLFCKPTMAQAEIYKGVLKSPVYGTALGSAEASLQLINVLKKVSNGPSLLNAPGGEDKPNEMMASLMESLPAKCQRMGPSSSTKLQLLDTLLHQLRETGEEKVVLVSNYTTTLDMMQRLLVSLNYPFLRLDGKTPQNKRQGLVDEFNKASSKKVFCFLLSTKAGGMGLNLVGASRLVLFDVDWNPANDLQAMARIHRDGQRHPCFIYRLVVAGTLEEKIYQRQVTKMGLSDAVVDAKKTVQAFSQDELRALFKWENRDEGCGTHDLLDCDCKGEGNVQVLPGSQAAPLEIESDKEYNEDEELPPLGQLINASRVNVQRQEEHIQKIQRMKTQRKKKDKMLALMQYLHIDVSKLRVGGADLESLVEDPVLLATLKDPNNMVTYVFSKTTS